MSVINQVGNALTGSTGSGAFVGANTPTLITPVLGAATGTSVVLTGKASANNLIGGFRTTATAAGTTTLTVSDAQNQEFTGSTTQTVVMPVTSTLVAGQQYYIINNSSGIVTVQSSGANTIQAMNGGSSLLLTCVSTSGTTAASWQASYLVDSAGVSSITGTANQVIASASTGAITLSTPQNIGTSSAVQFASITFGGGVLSDYVALTSFTPAFTFQTPGDLSVSYAGIQGYYIRIGQMVWFSLGMQFTPTYLTSSGIALVTGLPLAPNATPGNLFCVETVFAITYPTGVTQVVSRQSSSSPNLKLVGAGTGIASVDFDTTNFPTATEQKFLISGMYSV